MLKTEIIHPYKYFHHTVSTVAVYGNKPAVVFHGHLVLRTYYVRGQRGMVDQARTSAYVMDEVFYETNKVLREENDDNYGTRRVLKYVPFPQLGEKYGFVYNTVEVTSPRFDDKLTVLSDIDKNAKGVAIVMKKDHDGNICWLDIDEARLIANVLNGN
jgi:hypothetical protein